MSKDNNTTTWRPPIVGVLGHVDHGKTTLLDAIRKTQVQAKEAGGITQRISWSDIQINGKQITFIDTPGHKAFTVMRQIGGNIADIILLIVAADAGVKPQTEEAIEIIKSSSAEPIIVITKIDLESANPDKVKQELAEKEMLIEEWGGKIPCVEVSATEGKGIQDLLEMILLVAEMQELKYDHVSNMGIAMVLDSFVDKSLGKCSDLIIKKGSINRRMVISNQKVVDKVGIMKDAQNNTIAEVKEGQGVRIVACKNLYTTGEVLYIAEKEKQLSETYKYYKDITIPKPKLQLKLQNQKQVDTLEDLFADEDNIQVGLIIKADTPGILDAIHKELLTLESKYKDQKIKFVTIGNVGQVTQADIDTAISIKDTGKYAYVIAFDVKVDKAAEKKSKENGTAISEFSTIYKLVEYLEEVIVKITTPKTQINVVGSASIVQTFTLSNGDVVAGCRVESGQISKNAQCRIVRNGQVIKETVIKSLKHEKEVVAHVQKGDECGILLKGFNDLQKGDIIECIKTTKN